MLSTHLQNWLTRPANPTSKRQKWFWLGLSLAVSAAYGLDILHQAFSSEYVVSDDARQHVFWMQRFLDPALFPKDLIADYFQSVAPVGYTSVYRLFVYLGIEPLLLGKLWPPILGLVATVYCFFLVFELFPVPAAGFMASLLFTQNLWMRDDLASGTPRAFLNPIFLAFLYYLIRRSLWSCLVTIALLGWFYPQYVLIASGVLVLTPLRWKKGKLKLSGDRRDLWVCILGLAVAFAILLPYVLQSSEFGPTITAAEAKMLPEFLPKGRVRFFYDDFGRYWLTGGRSGIQLPLDPPLLCAGLLLPIILKFPHRFPLTKQVGSNSRILPHLTISSFALFGTAHALLFKLHLPSRYTQHSLRVVMSISAAIALICFLDSLFRWTSQPQFKKQAIALIVSTSTMGYLLLYPTSLSNFPKGNYGVGGNPELYQFFKAQPKDILIASLSSETDNLPTFSHRSILSAQEYAIPYHLGYYRQFRSRTMDLIHAQYTPNLAELQSFIQQYGINFWVIESDAFSPDYIKAREWMKQYKSTTKLALEHLKTGKIPALSNAIGQCPNFPVGGLLVVPTECIIEL